MKFLFRRHFCIFDLVCIWGISSLISEYGWLWAFAYLPAMVVCAFGEYMLANREMQP